MSRRAKGQVQELIKKHTPILFFVLETHAPFAKVSKLWVSLGYTPICI